MKTDNSIFTITLYNLGFFGGNREGVLEVDGQYKVVTDAKEFIILKVGGYGNMVQFPEVANPTPETLSAPSYRYVHDALLNQLKSKTYHGVPTETDLKHFAEGTRYAIHKNWIGGNIHVGDKVVDLRTNETIVAGWGHDLQYLNRNFNWKLVDRDLHPEPTTLEELIRANEAVNPFEGWVKLDTLPTSKKFLVERYIINGQTYTTVKDYSGNGRYVIQTPKGEVFEKKSSISAPFYNAVDILVGKIKSDHDGHLGKRFEYVYKDVVHEADYTEFFHPNNYVKVTEESSYDYNTRMTYL